MTDCRRDGWREGSRDEIFSLAFVTAAAKPLMSAFVGGASRLGRISSSGNDC